MNGEEMGKTSNVMTVMSQHKPLQVNRSTMQHKIDYEGSDTIMS